MLFKTGFCQVVILVCSALLLVSVHNRACPPARKAASRNLAYHSRRRHRSRFAPARIVVVAEFKGGSDDAEEFYCPTVEWEWGDGTVSTAEADCNPYEAGKSQIKRRYTVEHQFRNAGGFKISLRLKKGTRIAAMANAVVQVRAGLGPGF